MASRPPKSPEQRSAENARYVDRRVAAGIVKTYVMVPADRLPELKAILLAWREEAKQLLESDFPSADQILQIHAVVRTLRLRLPVNAFRTRATAAAWLSSHEDALGNLRAHTPRVRLSP